MKLFRPKPLMLLQHFLIGVVHESDTVKERRAFYFFGTAYISVKLVYCSGSLILDSVVNRNL